MPDKLVSLDLSDNALDETCMSTLETMISCGQLPHLECIDLSGNPMVPHSAKQGLLTVMKTIQAERMGCNFMLAPGKQFLVVRAPTDEDGKA